jgi:transcriptional regulator with XRE-family HTH domain
MKSPIAAYREAHELTQIQLAEILGVSQSFIANIERGDRAVTPKRAIEWEAKLGIDRAKLCPEIFGRATAGARAA